MNTLHSSLRGTILWLAPAALLALMLLWQTDWGRAFARTPPAETAPTPQPLVLALLPEYQPTMPAGGSDAVDRTLFNPTRRPAPTALVESAKPRIQRGQFALSGTLVVEGKATAYLREVNGGKSRRVTKGDTVNGMLVTEIQADRVRLTVGDESEEVVMKIATGPKTTIQPVMPTTPGQPVTATATPQGSTPAQPGAIPQARDVAEILAERRRAARAAEIAAQGLPPGAPVPQAAPSEPVAPRTIGPPPTVDPNAGDPRWQQLYQRYQQPRGR
jgi:hypothetical protein